jgi:O-succinylbenzoic acid--CoA ligase
MNSLDALLTAFNPNLKIDSNKDFILTNQKTFTYHSVIQSCTVVSRSLRQAGVEKNSLVPILMDNSPEFILSVLSLWMIEAIPVPINTKLSEPETEQQLKFLTSKHLIINDTYKEKVKLDGIKLINSSISNFDSDLSAPNFTFDENRTALIIFTSGSSDKPKAVELSFSNLIHSAQIGNNYLKQTTNDRWLASLPFYHIGGFSIIFRALMFGTQILLPDDLKTKSLHSSIHSFNPTLISLVSSQMRELLNKNIHPNRDLRHVLLGGGSIDSKLMQEALSKGWKVCKVYGSTETASFVTILSPEEFKLKPESAGKPIPPNEVLIVDENGNELPVDVEGEIAVKSPALMKRYLNDDESTKQRFKDGLYFTGDIGYKDDDGFLYVLNRRSDLIVTGGENVNPSEIEKVILEFSKVKEVCVFATDDEKWGQKITAAIVTKPHQQFTLEELKYFLKDKIAAFKIPKEIFFVDELPKTQLGKILHENLKKLLT